MARYEDISPTLLGKLFLEQTKVEFRKVLDEELDKLKKECVDRAVTQALSMLAVNVESYRSFDRFGEDIRVTLVDKREKNG